MAFVIEKLEEKDVEYVKSFGFRHPLSERDEAIIPKTWVTDRENNCYLICLAAGGDSRYDYDIGEYPPSYYRLIVDGVVIEIEARYKWEGDGTTGIKMWWKIFSITVLSKINMSVEEIKQLIKQSFETESKRLFKNHLQEVYFDLIGNPIFLDGGNQ